MKKEILWPLIIAIVTLILGQGIFYRVYNKPKMSYEILPIHKIGEDQIYSIIIKNKGSVLLHNILISLKSKLPIKKIRIDGPDIIDTSGSTYLVSGNLGERALQIKIDRLVTQSNYYLTVQTANNSDIDFSISSDEIGAVEEIKKGDVSSVAFILNVISALALGFGTFMLFKYYAAKKLATKESCREIRLETGKKMIEFNQLVLNELEEMIETLDRAKQQYDNKETFFDIIEKYKKFNLRLIDIFKDEIDSISKEGICINYSTDTKGREAD